MTDKKEEPTGTTEHETKFHKIVRKYSENTPDGLKVDWQKLESLQGNRMYMTKAVRERMDLLMREVDEDMEKKTRHMWGTLIFILVLVAGIIIPSTAGLILWLGGMGGWGTMMYLSRNTQHDLDKRFGMLDGIFFILIELSQELQGLENTINDSETLIEKVEAVKNEMEKRKTESDTIKE